MTTIVELNRQLGTGANGSWTNVLNAPLKINKGGTISVKNVFIDSQSLNNSENITLDSDVNIEIEVGYYVMNSEEEPIKQKVFKDALAAEPTHLKNDYDTYICRKPNYDPIVNTITTTIEKGDYTPSYLAEYINKKLSQITFTPKQASSEYGVRPRNNFFLRSDVLNNYAGPGAQGAGIQFHKWDEDTNTASKKYFEIKVDGDPLYSVILIGSSQGIGLSFDNKNNGRFSMEYLHTPIMSGTEEVVILRQQPKTGTNSDYNMWNRTTGIFFTKLEPKTFWEDTLGFDLNDMVCSFNSDKKIDKNLNDLGKVSTGGYIGLSNCINGESASAMAAWFSTSHKQGYLYTLTGGETLSIDSKKNYNPSQSGGYWLLSISGLGKDFYNDKEIRRDIQAIIPRQYSNNNYITAYQESSIPFINNGEPFLLSEVKVEILDPITKAVITDIGSNNAIYLQVD